MPNYPVIYFVYKRTKNIKIFLDIMFKAGVKKIYIFGDGPKNEEEKIHTDKVRELIADYQSKNGEVEIQASLFTYNKGLKINIIDGLNNVFKIEQAGIIIEDDCLPNKDFFRFANEVLDKYKHDTKIMSINGTSLGGKFKHSYDFTKYPQCWGWATWARAWKLYDRNLSYLTQASWDIELKYLNLGTIVRWYWHTLYLMIGSGQIKTWDYQWSFAHFFNHGLSIVPSVNLIKNTGFDNYATNTKIKNNVANLKTQNVTWPLIHPTNICENSLISHQIERHFYSSPIAIFGLLRQYFYWRLGIYANRN